MECTFQQLAQYLIPAWHLLSAQSYPIQRMWVEPKMLKNDECVKIYITKLIYSIKNKNKVITQSTAFLSSSSNCSPKRFLDTFFNPSERNCS